MFTAREVVTVLGLSAGRLRSYLRSGMVAPSRGDDGEQLTALELYERGCAVEESSPGEARELYRRALARDPDYADAHVNLGRLLHETNEVHAALLHYRSALKMRPGDATAAFNVGV